MGISHNSQTTALSHATLVAAIPLLLCCASNPAFSEGAHPKQSATNSSTQARQLRLLHGGQLITGLDAGAVVTTKVGRVVLAPRVTVYLFDTDRGVTVFNLDSHRANDVRFLFSKKQLQVKPAEVLAVTVLPKATFDDVAPGLGILHKTPQSVSIEPGINGFAAEFSLASAVQHIYLLQKMSTSTNASDRRTIDRILKSAAILQSNAPHELTTPTASTKSESSATISSEPTGVRSPTLKGGVEVFAHGKGQVIDLTLDKFSETGCATIPGLCWVEYVDGDWKSKDTTKLQSDPPKEIAGLISCPVNTVLKTELGYVDCKQGSELFVVNRKDSVAICALDTPLAESAIIHAVNGFCSKLLPGKEILLTKDLNHPFDEASPARNIGHREAYEIGTIGGIRVSLAEFSLPSAISAIAPLGDRLVSNKPEERHMIESMLKNAVILTNITAADGAYNSGN